MRSSREPLDFSRVRFSIYDADSTHSYKRLKIGDGTTNVIDLPFFNDNLEGRVKAIEDALNQTGYSIVLIKDEES